MSATKDKQGSRPFVSVIVPVFNDQAGLDRCHAALLQQSYPRERLEILLVDNNSSPPMQAGAGDAGKTRLLGCARPGSYAARNLGIEAARGEIFAFTDADCVPDRRWLECGVAALVEHGTSAVVGGEVSYRPLQTANATELYQYLIGFPQQENIAERGFAATANLFAWRRSFDEVGRFDVGLLSGGDLDWCLRASGQGIATVFCAQAVVVTAPRSDLKSAIRQARRVAGGRMRMRQSMAPETAGKRLQQHRGPLAAARFILQQRQLSMLARLRVLGAASVIRAAQLFETLRLRLGGQPERR